MGKRKTIVLGGGLVSQHWARNSHTPHYRSYYADAAVARAAKRMKGRILAGFGSILAKLLS